MKASLSRFPKHKLGELCEINIGKTPSRSKPSYWGGENPWLSIADMNQGRSLWRTKESITNEGIRASGIKPVPKNTLLLSYKLSIGKVGITERDMFTNEAIAALPVIDPSILSVDYLYWTLSTIDLLETSDRAAMGATLNKAKLKELQIPLPPLDEQKRIAAILDAADALRAKRRQSIAQLDALIQSTFLDLFGDPVTNPMGWKTANLESLSLKVTDGDHHTPIRTESGIKLLSARNVLNGEIDFSNTDFVGEVEYARMIKRCHPERGDVLISCSGSIGRVSRIKFDEPVVLVRSAALVKIDHAKTFPEFVEYLLRTPALQIAMQRAAKSVAQANLFQQPIKNLPVFIPPLPLQQKFAAIVESVERQKAAQRAHLAELDALFASLQHRAFRGEL
jgi:type I restriction enzyme S subunit